MLDERMCLSLMNDFFVAQSWMRNSVIVRSYRMQMLTIAVEWTNKVELENSNLIGDYFLYDLFCSVCQLYFLICILFFVHL